MNHALSPFWQTPIGWVAVAGGTAGIEEIILHVDADGAQRFLRNRLMPPELLQTVRAQIDEYFAGRRRIFDLPLVLPAGSFRARVLTTLRAIPYGTTVTYGELAQLVGHPRAARAVGGCMAANPFPLVIPCHRVLGAGGKMTGYSGGAGVASKEWLLHFEREMKRKLPYVQ